MPILPISLQAAIAALLAYVAIFLWTRHLERRKLARPRPFDLSPVFVVLLYALELSRGSRTWLYGLVASFLIGRMLQAVAVHTRMPVHFYYVGLAFCVLPILIVVISLMAPLL